MLEIVALIFLCRTNKRIVEEKEIASGKYIAYTILLWFGFESTFFVLGLVFFRLPIAAYLLSLMGAVIGGYLSYRIAQNSGTEFTDFEEIE